MAAAAAALELASRTAADDLLLLLLSGGASSLMALPAAGLTLADKRHAIGVLLGEGADVTELNTVRKHLSAIKGGRLAAACEGGTLTLAVSDVVGDDLELSSHPDLRDELSGSPQEACGLRGPWRGSRRRPSTPRR